MPCQRLPEEDARLKVLEDEPLFSGTLPILLGPAFSQVSDEIAKMMEYRPQANYDGVRRRELAVPSLNAARRRGLYGVFIVFRLSLLRWQLCPVWRVAAPIQTAAFRENLPQHQPVGLACARSRQTCPARPPSGAFRTLASPCGEWPQLLQGADMPIPTGSPNRGHSPAQKRSGLSPENNPEPRAFSARQAVFPSKGTRVFSSAN